MMKFPYGLKQTCSQKISRSDIRLLSALEPRKIDIKTGQRREEIAPSHQITWIHKGRIFRIFKEGFFSPFIFSFIEPH